MSFADLHLHSVYSDGLKTPVELCALADRLGIGWLSLCDHDTVGGLDAMARAVQDGNREREGRGLAPLSLIPGVEISTGPGGGVHLLAYGANPRNVRLTAFLAGIAADRRARAAEMLDRLEREGVMITREARALLDKPSVGRAHIARALVKTGAVRSVRQAFDRYLAQGRPAYVPRRLLTTAEAAARLTAMGLVVVLAHPMRMGLKPESLRALVLDLKACGLKGMEVYHPSAGRGGARMLEGTCRAEGLLVTGGSDYHGDVDARARIGRLPAGWHTQAADIRALLEALE